MEYIFCCPTLFGLEGIVADELRYFGKLTDVTAENGRVLFSGDANTLAWANLNLRCGERVLLRVGKFVANTFEELFEGVSAISWGDFLPIDAQFPVKGYSLDSKLFSVPDCQKIIKKAIVNEMGKQYGLSWFEETGEKYQVQFSIMHDQVEIFLDTTGAGLHKRGYRANANAAPLRETLAAAMVKIARWRGREDLYDPFCGSGTIAIEAALIAQKRAPGLTRSFDAEHWAFVPSNAWTDAREAALAQIEPNEYPIFASDIDPDCVRLTEDNARKAGVRQTIHASMQDATTIDFSTRVGTLLANPPYGERLLDLEQARNLYRAFGLTVGKSDVKQYILSSDPEFEAFYGFKADKKRKLYNGMIRCDLNMYFHAPSERKPFLHDSFKSKGIVNNAKFGDIQRKTKNKPENKR